MNTDRGKGMGCGRCCRHRGGAWISGERIQAGDTVTLAQLAPGQKGIVVGISPALRSAQKFADIGMIEGACVLLESYAPFGGLLRIRILDSSMALHFLEARHILVRVA